MADYKKMFTTLFNAITDVISVLQRAQQETEEMYISVPEPSITVLARPESDSNGKEKT